jgi:hypothetical protein
MSTIWIGAILKPKAAVLLVFLGICGSAMAQQVSFSLLPPPKSIEPASFVKSAEPVTLPEAPSHRFWDRKNTILFATNAAFCTADFVVTRNNLRNGGQELNPFTRVFAGSTAGLAVNFAGEAVGVVGVSYLLHKTGHHKMERAVSLVNIGSSAAAVTFDVVRR